jgi:predicted dehydrogenase
VGGLVIRTGIVGLSEGNGHPFSFSAIVNGYDPQAFERSGWPGILRYLEQQQPDSFGFPDVTVSHAWTQDPEVTRKLCEASLIPHTVKCCEDLVKQVDALIVARDDWRTHIGFARPFLKRGIPVFIDKPLSLDEAELAYFEPHLAAGLLMSTAGFRYARELDSLRDDVNLLGSIRHVSATVLNDLERYGVHMLDALQGVGLAQPREITRIDSNHESFALTLKDGTSVSLNCLGAVAKTFHVSVFGRRAHAHFDLHDNFTAFRRTLAAFFTMVKTRVPQIPHRQVIDTMKLVAAAKRLAPGQRWSIEDA